MLGPSSKGTLEPFATDCEKVNEVAVRLLLDVNGGEDRGVSVGISGNVPTTCSSGGRDLGWLLRGPSDNASPLWPCLAMTVCSGGPSRDVSAWGWTSSSSGVKKYVACYDNHVTVVTSM